MKVTVQYRPDLAGGGKSDTPVKLVYVHEATRQTIAHLNHDEAIELYNELRAIILPLRSGG